MSKRLPVRWDPLGTGSQDAQKVAQILFEAARIFGELRIAQSLDADALIERFDTNPDAEKLQRWLAKKGYAADEIFMVIAMTVSVLSEWETLPRRTQTEHRRLYDQISSSARALNKTLERTGSVYNRGYGRGLQDIALLDLLSAHERNGLASALSPNAELDDLELPSVSTLLERISRLAERHASIGTHHAQPGKRGANRGYFIRRIAEFFELRYGERPAEVIAAVTTVALDEPTDRELVSKLLKAAGTL